MMKPESKPIAESKIAAPKASYIQAEFKSETLFLYWFIMSISLVHNVYCNTYLDRYFVKNPTINYPRTESKHIWGIL